MNEAIHSEKSKKDEFNLDYKTGLMFVFALGVLIIYMFLQNITPQALIDNILNLDLIYLVGAICLTFLAIAVDSYAWKILLTVQRVKVSTLHVYKVFLTSFGFGLLIPSAGAAEIALRTILGIEEFENEEGSPVKASDLMASIVLQRVIGFLSFIPLTLIVTVGLIEFFNIPYETGFILFAFISVFSIIIISLFWLIARQPQLVISGSYSLFGFPGMFSGKYRNWFEEKKNGISEWIMDFCKEASTLLDHPKEALIAGICTVSAAIGHWAAFYCIIWALGIQAPFLLVATISYLGGMIDFIPLGIPGMEGIKEIANSEMLSLLPPELLPAGDIKVLTFSAAITISLVKFYMIAITGVILYAFRRKSKGEKQEETPNESL